MLRINRELPVLCHPPVPHRVKMVAKKLLRKMHGTADGWRELAMAANVKAKEDE